MYSKNKLIIFGYKHLAGLISVFKWRDKKKITYYWKNPNFCSICWVNYIIICTLAYFPPIFREVFDPSTFAFIRMKKGHS